MAKTCKKCGVTLADDKALIHCAHGRDCPESTGETVGDYLERAEKAEVRISELEAALNAINDIRNSIIGLQTINWSEHIYPLVEVLDNAGIEGMGYPKAREHFGTSIKRTIAAEAEVARLRAACAAFLGKGYANGVGDWREAVAENAEVRGIYAEDLEHLRQALAKRKER
jgi:hypothetical protein